MRKKSKQELSRLAGSGGSVLRIGTSDPFTDRIGLRQPRGTEQYALLDATGRMIWTGQHIEEQDFSALRSGAYFLQVSLERTLRTFRLVK